LYPEAASNFNGHVISRPASSTCLDRAREQALESPANLSDGFPNKGLPRVGSVPLMNATDGYRLVNKSSASSLLSVNDTTFRQTRDPKDLMIRLAAPLVPWMAPGADGSSRGGEPRPISLHQTDPAIMPKYLLSSFPPSNLMSRDHHKFAANMKAARAGPPQDPATFYPTRNPEFNVMRKTLPMGDPYWTAPTREATNRPIADPYSCAIPAGARIARASGTIYDGRPRYV